MLQVRAVWGSSVTTCLPEGERYSPLPIAQMAVHYVRLPGCDSMQPSVSRLSRHDEERASWEEKKLAA